MTSVGWQKLNTNAGEVVRFTATQKMGSDSALYDLQNILVHATSFMREDWLKGGFVYFPVVVHWRLRKLYYDCHNKYYVRSAACIKLLQTMANIMVLGYVEPVLHNIIVATASAMIALMPNPESLGLLRYDDNYMAMRYGNRPLAWRLVNAIAASHSAMSFTALTKLSMLANARVLSDPAIDALRRMNRPRSMSSVYDEEMHDERDFNIACKLLSLRNAKINF